MFDLCSKFQHSNTHIYAEWHTEIERGARETARDTHTLNNRRAFGSKLTLRQECLAKVHSCSPYHQTCTNSVEWVKIYNHIPSEEFLIRKEHWEWENRLLSLLALPLSPFVCVRVCEYLDVCVRVWLLVIFSKLSRIAVCNAFFFLSTIHSHSLSMWNVLILIRKFHSG